MLIRKLIRRNRKRTLGQSLVEFAIVLPVFLVLLSAALDLGRLAAARITVANAAREGAFQAANTPTSFQAGQPCPTPDTAGTVPPSNMVICRALLESKGSTISVQPSDVSLSCSPTCSTAIGNTVTVKVVGQFKLLTPFMAAILGGSVLNFSSSSTQQLEALPASSSAPTA